MQPWVEFFTNETMIHPLTAHPPQKRSFIPSKWEKQRVGRMVHSIKMGWMKPKKPAKDSDDSDSEDENMFYELWKDDDQVRWDLQSIHPKV